MGSAHPKTPFRSRQIRATWTVAQPGLLEETTWTRYRILDEDLPGSFQLSSSSHAQAPVLQSRFDHRCKCACRDLRSSFSPCHRIESENPLAGLPSHLPCSIQGILAIPSVPLLVPNLHHTLRGSRLDLFFSTSRGRTVGWCRRREWHGSMARTFNLTEAHRSPSPE